MPLRPLESIRALIDDVVISRSVCPIQRTLEISRKALQHFERLDMPNRKRWVGQLCVRDIKHERKE
jgi:hypothetical protein